MSNSETKRCQTCKRQQPASIVLTAVSRTGRQAGKVQHQCIFCVTAGSANVGATGKVSGPQLQELWERQGGVCAYTGETIRLDAPGSGSGSVTSDKATIDHVIPKGEGGKNVIENLVWASHRANTVKQNDPPAVMYDRLDLADSGHKRCSTCGDAKSLDAFHNREASKDKKARTCKDCARKYSRRHKRSKDEAAAWRTSRKKQAEFAAETELIMRQHWNRLRSLGHDVRLISGDPTEAFPPVEVSCEDDINAGLLFPVT